MSRPSPVVRLLVRISDTTALVGAFALFASRVAVRLVTRPLYVREIVDATALVTVRCYLPVLLVLGPFGMVFALHGTQVLGLFSAERLLGFMVAVATFRELAPNLTAILVAAQAGSAFAAELAAMQAQEEIDATLVMGVDPIRYHVVPRVAGMVLASPILTLIGGMAGILGGWFLAIVMLQQDSGAFWDSLYATLTPFDLAAGAVKSMVFGAIVGMLACFLGYRARGSVAAVGEAVNHTVVYGVTLFLVTNYFLSTAMFGITD